MAAVSQEMSNYLRGRSFPTHLHRFTPGETARAHSSAALQKRRETFRQKIEDRAHDIRALAAWGMVPAAIADELGTKDGIVERELRRAGLWRRWLG
jgi:IS30 family transposase